MRENLEISTGWILAHEGGYVNHPDDPGGATNFGVIQQTYNAWRVRKQRKIQSVKLISQAEVLAIYKEQYWDKIWGDELPTGLDYALYDFAINSGPSRAIKFLQELIGVKQDGVLGNITLQAIRTKNIENLIDALCFKRWKWLKRLRNWKTFGVGWTRRVMGESIGFQKMDYGVIDRAIMLAKNVPNIPAPSKKQDGSDHRTDGEEKLNRVAQVEEGLTFDNLSKIALGSLPAWGLSYNGDLVVGVAMGVLVGIIGFWIYKKLR